MQIDETSIFSKAEKYFAGGEGSKARELLEPLANDGNPRAQRLLGEGFLHGLGMPQDEVVGLAWLEKSFENGDAKAALDLALFFAVKGSDSNMKPGGYASLLDEAFKRLMKDAEAGDAEAMRNVGVCYQSGWGCDINDTEAYKWVLKSFQNGFAFAANDLYSLHSETHSPWYDPEKARFFFKYAESNNCLAVLGDPQALD